MARGLVPAAPGDGPDVLRQQEVREADVHHVPPEGPAGTRPAEHGGVRVGGVLCRGEGGLGRRKVGRREMMCFVDVRGRRELGRRKGEGWGGER